MNKIFLIIVFCSIASYAQLLRVDSVQVDSIWNSDSTWYDAVGILQSRISRDCLLSFVCKSQGMVSCSLSVSLDTGRTWDQSPNPLRIIDTSYVSNNFSVIVSQQSKPFIPGLRKTFKVRMLTGDKDGVVFRVICRQYAPSITGSPKIIYIFGPVDSICNIPLQVIQSSGSNAAQAQIKTYYWDFFGDGIYDDSTNTGLKNWLIAIPNNPNNYVRRATVVYAKDINGIISPPETLIVTFLHNVLDTAKLKINTIIAGSIDNAEYGSSINFDIPQTLIASVARANDSLIDLVYANSFISPDTVVAYGFNILTGWKKYNATKFYKATGIQSINPDTLALPSQVAELWHEQNVVSKISSVSAGDLFLLKTDLNKVVLFRVSAIVSGRTGSVTLKVYQ